MTVLSAKLKLIESPQQRSLVGLGYEDTFHAADDIPKILEFSPIGLEGFDGSMVDGLRKKRTPGVDLLPKGGGFLLVELGSNDSAETERRARQMMDALKRGAGAPDMRLFTAAEAKTVWQIREAGPRAGNFAPGRRWFGKAGTMPPWRRKNLALIFGNCESCSTISVTQHIFTAISGTDAFTCK